VVSRFPLLLLLVVALSACGSNAQAPSPSSVVRAWSNALNAGDNQRAADLFARDAQIVQGNLVTRLHTHSDAVAFNRALPCSGRIVDLRSRGRDIEATFVLGNRPASQCDGPGERAAALFRIRGGKIVLWHQIPVAPAEPVV
jgi:limonene-1,2-epoxide hydrolase